MIHALVIVAGAMLFAGMQDTDRQKIQQERNAELEFMVG